MTRKVKLRIHDIRDSVGASDALHVTIHVTYQKRFWLVDLHGTFSEGLDKYSAWPAECDSESKFIGSDKRMPPSAIRELGRYIDEGLAFQEALKITPGKFNLYHLNATKKRLLEEFDGCIDKRNEIDTSERLLAQVQIPAAA